MQKKSRNNEDEDYVVERKKKKKVSTVHNCLLHCRIDCDSDEIVKFSEISWKVSRVFFDFDKRIFLSRFPYSRL